MKTNTKLHTLGLTHTRAFKSLLVGALVLSAAQSGLQAQESPFTKPSWFFGVAGGANLNFYRGSTQELNEGLTVPAAFHNAQGVGLYVAPTIEFHRPESRWGVILQAGYDNRKATSDEVRTPCNCPADLETNISYITVEPSLRFAPFKGNLYLYAGPRIAFNLEKEFEYQLGLNPAYPNQEATPAVSGDYSKINATVLSMQVGAGYDIYLSSQNRHTQWVLSPFVSFQPYYGQDPRSIETQSLTTLRLGVALKFGVGHRIPKKAVEQIIFPMNVALPVDSTVHFSVSSPKNIRTERRMRETFPLRNYVFFDLGSTKIPERYILLNRDQVNSFQNQQMEVFEPKKLSGLPEREMLVYHNILNILGDRMQNNPKATIVLVGSSEKGPDDARLMAQSIKTYLVGVFGIEAGRIKIEGRYKPKIPSEQPGGTKELDLLREGDRRVSIESSSPALIMQFQTGEQTPLKEVELVGIQVAPLESYITFSALGATEAFSTWSLEIKDAAGVVQTFGPYTEDSVSIAGKDILGTRPEGDFSVKMIGQTKSGKTVIEERSVFMVLWQPAVDEEMMRFNIIYEFNNAKAIALYRKYLTKVVIPKIPIGATVLIHGHTDIIGDATNNKRLSLARANDVKVILQKGLAEAKRTDVKMTVFGFGEEETFSTFKNNLPEERFYNRTVIIDIIPRP